MPWGSTWVTPLKKVACELIGISCHQAIDVEERTPFSRMLPSVICGPGRKRCGIGLRLLRAVVLLACGHYLQHTVRQRPLKLQCLFGRRASSSSPGRCGGRGVSDGCAFSIEHLNEIVGDLNLQSDLRSAVDDRRRTSDGVEDRPADSVGSESASELQPFSSVSCSHAPARRRSKQ